MAQTRRVELALPADQGYERVLTAFRSVGKVEQESSTTRSVVGKIRYGLNPVRLRVSVLTGATEASAVVDVSAVGQDILGAAGRKATDKLVAALG